MERTLIKTFPAQDFLDSTYSLYQLPNGLIELEEITWNGRRLEPIKLKLDQAVEVSLEVLKLQAGGN